MVDVDEDNPQRLRGTLDVWSIEDLQRFTYNAEPKRPYSAHLFRKRAGFSEDGRESISHAVFSPDGSILAAAGWASRFPFPARGSLSFWSAHDGELIRTIATSSPVGQLAFSRDGDQVASVGT